MHGYACIVKHYKLALFPARFSGGNEASVEHGKNSACIDDVQHCTTSLSYCSSGLSESTGF